MSNMSRKDAEQQCAEGNELAALVEHELEEIRVDIEGARADLEGERSAWDESTVASGGGLLGIVGGVLLCLAPDPTLLTKVGCGVAIGGGVATVGASEYDRFDEINKAEERLDRLQERYDRLRARTSGLREEYNKCVSHHVIQVRPLGPIVTPL